LDRNNLSIEQFEITDLAKEARRIKLKTAPPSNKESQIEVFVEAQCVEDHDFFLVHLFEKDPQDRGETSHLNKIIDNTVNTSIERQKHRIQELTNLVLETQEQQRGLYAQVRVLEEAKNNLEFFGQIIGRDIKECFSSLMIAARLISEIKTLEPPQELERLRRYSSHIMEKIQSIDRLAQDIISFSHSGMNGLEWSDFYLESAVVSAMKAIHSDISESRTEVKVMNNCHIQGNPNLISLALQDLLLKIIQESKTDPAFIEVRAVNLGSETVVSLSEKMGGPQRLIDLHANRSHQLAKRAPIAKKIIEAHGGKLWKRIDPDFLGANYFFTLASWAGENQSSLIFED
jgi:light-regulated signal transduction histidine kinase (bacteriophytochrome)